MRLCCVLLLGCYVAAPAWSQGQILVANRASIDAIDAPVFDSDWTGRLVGPAYQAQAYVGLTSDSLAPLGWVVAFRTGDTAGYISSYVVTVPEAPGGTLVYFQLRAWEARAGPTYEAAVTSGGKHGFSNVVPIRTVMPPGAPNSPIGLESFCLVPEPSPCLLLLLGGGVWLIVARRWTRDAPCNRP
jgi:hypothetical protein